MLRKNGLAGVPTRHLTWKYKLSKKLANDSTPATDLVTSIQCGQDDDTESVIKTKEPNNKNRFLTLS